MTARRVDPAATRPRPFDAGSPLLPVPGDPDLVFVPEHEVKRWLAASGVAVPNGAVVPDAAALGRGAAGLAPPLVLKAWGPGLLHKTDAGAVRLGLAPGDLEAAGARMAADLAARALTPEGFLVEEQLAPGVELIVGVARRPPLGALAMVGLGGTLAEVLDDVAFGLPPVSRDGAARMLNSLRSAPLLTGTRGRPAVDVEALVDLVVTLAGAGGLVEQLGGRLSDLECNPVIARPDGAYVADARLVLRRALAVSAGDAVAPLDAEALFAPSSIAVAGASTRHATFGNRALAAYRELGWVDGLYALHPSAGEIDGVPAVPALRAVPGGRVDYLLVAVPAAACADVLAREGAHAAVAQVVTAGFAEMGAGGAELEAGLLAAARSTGVRVVGPNCIGTYAPAGRQTFLLGAPTTPGHVGFISQSGGLAGDVVMAGSRRGLRFSKLASLGNAVDVTPAEILEHLAGDAGTQVIGMYLEGAADGERLVAAMRGLRGRKPLVALIGGLTGEGARAVASHTASLTGERRAWEAVADALAVTIVPTLEDLLGTLLYLQRWHGVPASGDGDTLVIGVGGGSSVMAADACARAGVRLAPVGGEIVGELRAAGFGSGTSVTNPIEVGIGPQAPAGIVNQVLDVVLGAQRYADVIVHVNLATYYGYGSGSLERLSETVDHLRAGEWGTRMALVLRNAVVAPGADREAVETAVLESGIPAYATFDEAARAVAAAQRFTAARVER